MPQLEELQSARQNEYNSGNAEKRKRRPDSQCQKDPEYLVEDTARIIVEPPRSRAIVEFSSESNSGDYQQDTQMF